MAQVGKGTIDQQLSDLSVRWRDLAEQALHLATQVTGQGNGLSMLQAAGYSTTANPANPGGISDADLALQGVNYLALLGELFFGTAAQPANFNFNNAMSPHWGGRI